VGLSRVLGLFLFALLNAAAAVVPDGVVSFNTNIVFQPSPSSLLSGSLESNSHAFGFVEKINFALVQALPVDIRPTPPYEHDYILTGDTNPGNLALGTKVNSYFIHYDPVGSSDVSIHNPGTIHIEFLAPIIGIQVTRLRQGNAASSQLHLAGVTYETRDSTQYGVELDSGANSFPDWIHVIDPYTVDIRLHSSLANIDDLRILTVGTPEPGSLILLGSGLGAVLFGLRRRRSAS
jgi:hypothetical protein